MTVKYKVGDRIVAIPNTNKADLYRCGSTSGIIVSVDENHDYGLGVQMDKPVKKGYEGTIFVSPHWIELDIVYNSPLYKALI